MKNLCSFIVFFVLSCLSSSVIYANNDNNHSQLIITQRQLTIDRLSNDLAKKQFFDLQVTKRDQYKFLTENGVDAHVLKHAQLDYVSAKAAVEGANIALTDAQQANDDTENEIRKLEKRLQSLVLISKGHLNSENDEIISIETELEVLRKLLQIQSERLQILTEIKNTTQQRLLIEKSWQAKIRILFNDQQQQTERNRLDSMLSKLQQEQHQWLTKLSQLNAQLQTLNHNNVTNTTLRRLQFHLLEAEENVSFIRLKSYILHLEHRAQTLHEVSPGVKSSTVLNELSQQVNNLNSQLLATNGFIKAKIEFLNLKNKELNTEEAKQVLSSIDRYSYSTMLTNLESAYHTEEIKVDELQQKTNLYENELKLQLQHHLSERQKFPSDLNGWVSLVHKMLQIPHLVYGVVTNFFNQALVEIQQLNTWIFNLILVSVGVTLALWFYFRRFILALEINVLEKRQRFSTNLIYILLELMRRNLGSVLIIFGLIIINLLFEIQIAVLLYLSLVYLGYKVILTIAKLTLLENLSHISGNDVKLYSQIRWTFLIGALFSVLVVLTHHLPVAYEAKTLANRFFMIFILFLSILTWKVNATLPALIEIATPLQKKYVYRALRLLCLLIPIALFFNAILGLLGFVELAWTIAKYQIIFVLVLASYLIVRGLLVDVMEFISELFISYIKQGWLWTEAFLKPLDRVLRIFLFLTSLVTFLHFCGLDHNTIFLNTMSHYAKQKLFMLGGNAITPIIMLQFLVIILVIQWLARWSREFSYRWLYVKAKDLGVRNSLAIFTQYASVVIAVLVALKLLGIDLRGFTVVAAAFAAGIGFGLRDLIINFFSGILLLIERPFRNGDIITLGIYEGEVVHTGMRSLTIRTWDHMDVIVPNADMFTKPFVNWTHHDNIVRSVITIKIHRDDSPHHVKNLIFSVLKNHPQVVSDPAPEVIIHEMSESLTELQVRYYILLGPHCARVTVRSNILFAIWDCFKANNIRVPNQEYDLVLKHVGAMNPLSV